jgi:hypothetical protein
MIDDKIVCVHIFVYLLLGYMYQTQTAWRQNIHLSAADGAVYSHGPSYGLVGILKLGVSDCRGLWCVPGGEAKDTIFLHVVTHL